MTGRRTSERLRRPSRKAVEAAESADLQANNSSKSAENILRAVETQPTEEAGPSTIQPIGVTGSTARLQTLDSANGGSNRTSGPIKVSSPRLRQPQERQLSTSARPPNIPAQTRGPLSTLPPRLANTLGVSHLQRPDGAPAPVDGLAQVPQVPDLTMPLRLATFLGVSYHRLPAPIVAPANGRSSERRQRRQDRRNAPPAPLVIDPQLFNPPAFVNPAHLHTVPRTPPNSATADALVFGNTQFASSLDGVSPENDQQVSPFTPRGSGDVVMTTEFEEDEATIDHLNENNPNDFVDFNPPYGSRSNYPEPPQ